jgi:peptidoglycan hydrolase-like protein with peptidoglycan-binding domain
VAVIALMGAIPAAAEAKKPSRATVAAVQEKLGIPADGVAGPQTRRAVKRFQRSKGLTVDGVIGPQTLQALGLSARASGVGVGPRSTLQKIAECESGGDPTAISPDGRYRGKYQFSRATWRSLGGEGDPARASEAEQDRMARLLMKRQGPGAWPNCA